MLLTAISLALAPSLPQTPQPLRSVVVRRVSAESSAGAEVAPDEDRPMLGVQLDVEEPVVRGLIEGGAAERAGLQAGDRITKVGKKKVKDTEGLLKAIRSHKPGDEINIRVMRGEERVDHKVTLTSASRLHAGEPAREIKLKVITEGERSRTARPVREIRSLGGGMVIELNEDLGEIDLEGLELGELGEHGVYFHRMDSGGDEHDGRSGLHEESAHEDVNYWESEDGSHRRIEIQASGEHISPERIQDLLREHGVDIEFHGGEIPGGQQIEIDVHVESDGEGPLRGERLLEVFRRLEGEDLGGRDDDHRGGHEGDEHELRWIGAQGLRGGVGPRWGGGEERWTRQGGRQQGRGWGRMREDGDQRRSEGRWMRDDEGRDRGEGRRMRDDEGRDRPEGRRMREGDGRDRGEGRRMRDDEGRDRAEGGRMREGDGRDRPEGRRMREGDGRDRPEGRRMREGEGRDRGEGRRRMRDDEDRRGHDSDSDGWDVEHDFSDHSEMEPGDRMRLLEEERERRMEAHHRHGEELDRGFEEAFHELEQQGTEHIRNLHEERQRVLEELHQRIEEVSRSFDEALEEAERGFSDRMRDLEGERERRSEELRERGEETSRRYGERLHELEEQAAREHD